MYYSWNRNTAFSLYNQLPNQREWKWLGHMINPNYRPLEFLMALFLLTVWWFMPAHRWSMAFSLVFSTGLDWFQTGFTHNTYSIIITMKKIFFLCLSIRLQTKTNLVLNNWSQHLVWGSNSYSNPLTVKTYFATDLSLKLGFGMSQSIPVVL